MMMEKVICATDISDPVRCPQCGGGDLRLEGILLRDYTEVWKDGEVVNREFDENSQLQHEIFAIECSTCQVRFLIETQTVIELIKANQQLATALLKASGTSFVC